MPIHAKTGKKYLSVSQNVAPYTKQEVFQVTEPNGSISQAFRDVEISPESINQDNYSLESAGWFSEISAYKEIALQTVYRPMENSMSFRKTSAIVLCTYRVIPDRESALLKIMPSGIYERVFKENGKDLTVYYPLSTNQLKAGNYVLLNEQELTPKSAKEMIDSGIANCLDLGLRKSLICDRI
jgi:hypothetical protein